MISDLGPGKKRRSKMAARRSARLRAATLNYRLRFAVVTEWGGAATLRYFRSPQDAEGVDIRLTAGEAEQLCDALIVPGFHTLLRDEGAGNQHHEEVMPNI